MSHFHRGTSTVMSLFEYHFVCQKAYTIRTTDISTGLRTSNLEVLK